MKEDLLGGSSLIAWTIGTLYILILNFIYVNINICTTGRLLPISCYIFLYDYCFSVICTKISCFPKYFVPLLGGGAGCPHLSNVQARCPIYLNWWQFSNTLKIQHSWHCNFKILLFMSGVWSCKMKREINSNWYLDRLHSTPADLYLLKMDSRCFANLLVQIWCQVFFWRCLATYLCLFETLYFRS